MPSHAKSPETQSSHASLTDVNVHTNLVYALWTGLIVVTTLVMGLVTLLEGNGTDTSRSSYWRAVPGCSSCSTSSG